MTGDGDDAFGAVPYVVAAVVVVLVAVAGPVVADAAGLPTFGVDGPAYCALPVGDAPFCSAGGTTSTPTPTATPAGTPTETTAATPTTTAIPTQSTGTATPTATPAGPNATATRTVTPTANGTTDTAGG